VRKLLFSHELFVTLNLCLFIYKIILLTMVVLFFLFCFIARFYVESLLYFGLLNKYVFIVLKSTGAGRMVYSDF